MIKISLISYASPVDRPTVLREASLPGSTWTELLKHLNDLKRASIVYDNDWTDEKHGLASLDGPICRYTLQLI